MRLWSKKPVSCNLQHSLFCLSRLFLQMPPGKLLSYFSAYYFPIVLCNIQPSHPFQYFWLLFHHRHTLYPCKEEYMQSSTVDWTSIPIRSQNRAVSIHDHACLNEQIHVLICTLLLHQITLTVYKLSEILFQE